MSRVIRSLALLTAVFCAGNAAHAAARLVMAGREGAFYVSSDEGTTWSTRRATSSTKNLEAVGRARLPNLAVAGVRLNEACEAMVTLTSTGPARVPPEAWDGRVTLALTLPEGLAAELAI
jgi:photosystem II stability/assembly factor-like uncharacterized protein